MSEAERKEWWDAGYEAAVQGKLESANPYLATNHPDNPGNQPHYYWHLGWVAGNSCDPRR
jgi:hypothetical protein